MRPQRKSSVSAAFSLTLGIIGLWYVWSLMTALGGIPFATVPSAARLAAAWLPWLSGPVLVVVGSAMILLRGRAYAAGVLMLGLGAVVGTIAIILVAKGVFAEWGEGPDLWTEGVVGVISILGLAVDAIAVLQWRLWRGPGRSSERARG